MWKRTFTTVLQNSSIIRRGLCRRTSPMTSLEALCTRAPSNNWLSLYRPPRAAVRCRASSSKTAWPYQTRVQTRRDLSSAEQMLSVGLSASLWHLLAMHSVARWDRVRKWRPQAGARWRSSPSKAESNSGLLLAQHQLCSAACMGQPKILHCIAGAHARLARLSLCRRGMMKLHCRRGQRQSNVWRWLPFYKLASVSNSMAMASKVRPSTSP